MTGATKTALSVKFLLPQLSFRIVVNESGTWQRALSNFLQFCLNVIKVDNPLSLRSSEKFTSLSHLHSRPCEVVSLDIKCLYYSLHKSVLIHSVKNWLQENMVTFQSQTGIGVGSGISLEDLYLRSTELEVDGQTFALKQGVCIGTSLALIL